MRTLEQLKVKNFKSIHGQTLRLGRLNVFIGGNGSGKSNLIGVFHFLNRVVAGDLQNYTGEAGGADSILYFGRKQSPSLAVELEFGQAAYANGYRFTLRPTAQDRFIFSSETIWFHDRTQYPSPLSIDLGSGHAEARAKQSTEPIAGHVRDDLESYRIYHFVMNAPATRAQLKEIRNGFPTPEDINDNLSTTLSARVLNVFPNYRKRLHGPLTTGRIGLDTIRRECAHFNQWVSRLENLGNS